jgi:bacteriocin-like protein
MEEVLRELTETELASVAGGGSSTINNQDSNQGIQVGLGIDNQDSNQGVQGVNIGTFTFPPVSP